MAEKKSGGGGMKKKIGPLPIWGYAAVGGGLFLIYYIIKRREAAAAASSTGVSTNLVGGDTIPSATPGSSGPTTYSDFGSWESAAISSMANGQLSPADALNGITSWINGQCVTPQQYTGISNIISSVGLPPGFGSGIPVLSVCGSSTTPVAAPTAPPTPAPVPASPNSPPGPAPNLTQQIAAAMTANGETIFSTQWDPVLKQWIFATNKGGIYNLNPDGTPGSNFYGSFLGLPASDRQGGARSFNSLNINPDGTYTLTDTMGENYTFNPQTAQLEGV